MRVSKISTKFVSVMIFLGMFATSAHADFCCPSFITDMYGKVDIGPAYVHIDDLKSNHTVKSMDLPAVKADATVLLREGCGVVFKPSILYGGSGQGHIFTAGIGVGHCFPIKECFIVTPIVGVQYTDFHTHIPLDIELPNGAEIRLHDTKEKFWAISPYLGLEVVYKISSCWRIAAMYQYAWSRTHTQFTNRDHSYPFLPSSFKVKKNSDSEGPIYSAMIERDITDCWSVNFAGAYNSSLTKEKHGLRGYGFRLGTAYWF